MVSDSVSTFQPQQAKDNLGWKPKIGFDELVAEMVRKDLKAAFGGRCEIDS